MAGGDGALAEPLMPRQSVADEEACAAPLLAAARDGGGGDVARAHPAPAGGRGGVHWLALAMVLTTGARRGRARASSAWCAGAWASGWQAHQSGRARGSRPPHP